MALYFETAVRYDKMCEDGAVKKVTEKFLLDALTFTEAEARIIEERAPYISGEFTVSAVKKTKIAEIFGINTYPDQWWLAKVAFITVDEKTSTEKKTVTLILVGASDFHNALANFEAGMKDTMADYELQSLSLTDILEVYPVDLSADNNEPS